MLDLSIYPKFLRDISGNTQSLEVMIVVGWHNNQHYGYYETEGGQAIQSLITGSPKHDAILLSSAQQSFGTWSYNDPFWQNKIYNYFNTSYDDNITLTEISQVPGDPGNQPRDFKMPMYWFDFGVKIPYFEEKINVFTRKYNVNDLTLNFDNFDSKDISAGLNGWGDNLNVTNNVTGETEPYPFGRAKGNFRLSDIIKIRPIANETVAVFLKSPSAKVFADMVPIYKGVVTEYKHDDKKVTIALEDYSESTFNIDFPTQLLPDGASTPERYKNKPIPAQIGIIDRAPGIFTRVTEVNTIQEDDAGEENGDIVSSQQDIIYFDTEPLQQFYANDIEINADYSIHQSPLFIYEEGYWNISQKTADEEGNEIPLEDGGLPNFTISSDNNKIYMLGTAFDTVNVINPLNENEMITLEQYATGNYGSDDALDAILQLYQGEDGEAWDDVSEDGEEVSNSETNSELGNQNLFQLQNDTVKNRFRIHAFSKPEDVKVKIREGARRSYFKTLFESQTHSYESQEAHDNNNPDDILDMTKCYNWDGNTPNTTSFVEVKGHIVGRYRYNKWNRTYYYPTFAADFGTSGSLPFNDFTVLTDTAYYMKSLFQCSHSAAFGIYTGSHALFIDQSSWWVNRHNPAARYPEDESGNSIQEATAPGAVPNSKTQWWQHNIDTIGAGESSIINDLGLTVHTTDLFENTSQWAQQNDEVYIGPFEMVQRRNGLNWTQAASSGSNRVTAHQYYDDTVSIFKNSYNHGAAYDFTLRLYNISAFSTILVPRNSKYDFYANLMGRTAFPFNQVKRKPADVIKILLEKETDFDMDYTSQQASNDLHESWNLDFAITERDEFKNYLQGIGQATRVCPSFNSLGTLKLNDIKSRYVIDDTEKIFSGDVIKYSIDRTPMRDVFNKLTLNYHKNYAEGTYEKSVTLDYNGLNYPLVANFSNSDQQTLTSTYSESFFSIDDSNNKITEKIYDCDYVRSDVLRRQRFGITNGLAETDETANKLMNFLIAFHANQHTIIKCTLPLKYFYLEVGDVIRFDELLGDSKVLAYGEDYTKLNIRNGQYIYPVFYITKVKRRLDRGIEIESMQMHFLNELSSTDHGWQGEEESEYEIYGCLDESATNYNPDTTVEVPCLYPGDIDNSGRIDWIDIALMQLAIVQESPYIEQTDGAYFKQLDVDEDGIISIKDITTLMINILQSPFSYGCMDGPGEGAGWGPADLPEADTYDPMAIIHVQEDCVYNTYACGPETFNWNWCVSEQDTYDADWTCLAYGGSNEPTGDNYEGIDLYMDNLIKQRLDDVLNNGNIDWYTESQGLTADDDRYMNSMRLVHRDGLGSWFDVINNHETPVGTTYANYSNNPHNPLSGIYILSGRLDDNDISFNFEGTQGNGGTNHFGNSTYHQHCQVPSVFMPIRLKAGHQYLMYNSDYQVFYDEDNQLGMGTEFYIGSPFQNVNSNENNSVSGASNSEYIQSFSNPTFVAGFFGGCRVGHLDVWGQDSWDNYLIAPRIFTAPSDPNIIPATWDLPGPGWEPAHPSGNYIWPDALEDYNATSQLYGVSPLKTNQELRSYQSNFMSNQNPGFGISNSYSAVKLNASWYDYFHDNSFANQDAFGNNNLPFGYEYETCVVALYYANGSWNQFNEGYFGYGIDEVFQGFGLIDITEYQQNGLDIIDAIQSNMGSFCTDNVFSILDPSGLITGGN